MFLNGKKLSENNAWNHVFRNQRHTSQSHEQAKARSIFIKLETQLQIALRKETFSPRCSPAVMTLYLN